MPRRKGSHLATVQGTHLAAGAHERVGGQQPGGLRGGRAWGCGGSYSGGGNIPGAGGYKHGQGGVMDRRRVGVGRPRGGHGGGSDGSANQMQRRVRGARGCQLALRVYCPAHDASQQLRKHLLAHPVLRLAHHQGGFPV